MHTALALLAIALGWYAALSMMCYATGMNIKSLGQDLAVGAMGAIVPLLPSLLDSPPTITPRELARMALSAACAVGALYIRKYKPSVEAPK